ncbi:MAG: collagen binding domain-containing protein [Candidatus Micrarchaeia archaeon]
MSEFFDGVQESWESFLDWSDEQGLPLKDVAVALEEKGVPSLPVFLLVFLFIAGALFLAVSPGALEEVFPPEKSTVTVRLIEAGTGVPLEVAGLPVYLIAEVDSDVYTVNGVTDDSGKVVFEDVVPGEYSVKLSADAYFAADSDISVSAGGSEVVDLQASSALSKRVSLSVDVGGAGNATVLLFDSDGVQIGSSSGFAPSFDVSPNANYTVKVSARGFLDNETLVVVGPGSVTKTVNLFPRETFSSMNLSVRVLDSKSREYVANASVSLIDNATERVLFSSLPSDGDGNARFSRVSIGQSLLVSVSADGFEPAQVPYVADLFNSSVLVYLKRIDPSGLKSLDVVVTDSDGRLLSGVVVQLFSGNKKSGYPAVTTRSKGVASFRVRGGDYYVTAFKSNYLPGFAEDVPAGGRVAVSLESASGNSGSLKVFVEDENAVALSEASVALYRSGGRPLGIPQRVTGIDGSTVFSFVPFEEVFARASRNGRTGESERVQVVPIGEEGVNATEITVRLLPQKGSVVATVRDHFSRELVSGAIVEVSTKESASCRTAKGTCSVAVEEGFARVRVTANGFSEFSSSEFEVFPNANNRIDVELVSEAVSQGVKARFVGLFDFAGRKVSSLGPSSVYTAKFLLTSPRGVNYSKALFHARVGGVETPIDVENAFVSGYEALSARITAASEYEEVVDEFSNESLSVSPELAPETGEFKWVSFEFSPFRGTREVSLTLRTRQVTNGSVSLGYRSAFTTAGEVLRDPEDSDAGISKSELLAAVNSKRFDISFEGRCVEGLCLRSFVSSSRGKFSDNFEALVPEKFDLKVLPLSADYDALSLSLIVEGGSAKLIDVESGSLKGSLVNTELGQELSITVDQGKEAVFSLQALRPSNDLKLRLSASHRGNVLLQEVYSGRVVTSRNASLKVKAVPSVLKALVSNKVLFTVKDEFGNPVEDARIVLGSSTDALGAAFDLLGSGEDGGGKDGKYFVDEVTPSKVGAVSYFVEATGFSVFKSRLKVDASQIISVQPADLVSVDVQLGPASVVPITVENLLDNAVRVAVLVVPSRPENLTVVSIAPSELKLGELQPGLVDFSAVISTDVLTVAERARTLSEEANGTIVLKAKVGKSSQTVVVPYELTASFEQLKLDDLWTISGDPEPQVLEFEIDLDDQASLDANVFLASSAVYPLLINHQEPGNPAWLEVSPLSLVLPAVEEGEVEEQEKQVRVSVRVPKQFEKDDCIFEQEGVLDAVIEFFASYQGVVSKKVLPVKLSLYSSSDCAPGGGITLSLPIDASFTLPSKTKSKRNNDDSVAVELPSKRRILFSADVTVDDSSKRKGVVIPQNASFTLPPQFTSVTSAENFEFWFPFEVTYELGAQRQKITNRDGTTTVIFASQDKITFPQGTSFPPNPEMQGGFNAVVPANGRVKVERASLESTTCPTSIAMPDASTITLPEGTTTDLDVSTGRTRVKTSDCSQLEVTSSDGTFMRLPSSNAYDFNAPATVKPTSEGTFLAQVPKGRPFTFYPCSAVEGALNEYVLKFPIQTTVLVPAKAAVDSSAITFASCEKIISIDQHGARTQFPSARSLMIPDAKVLDKDENGNVPVVVPANSEITVTGCACVLGDSSAVSISYAYKYLQLKDKSVTFNLSNTNREGIQEACLYNKGTETIRVKATANVADPSNLGALGFISNDDLFFAKDFEHSNMLEPTEQGDQCREFQVRATLPEALIDDFGCVKKTENKNTYEGAVKFGGETTKGIPIGENYAPRLKVFINVEADSSGCWYEQKKDVHQSLYEFFVNYDSQQDNPRQKEKMQLVFKDKGHERFVTLINNRDEDVEVEYSNAGRHVECFEGEDELSKLHMPSGTSKVVRCVSKKQGTLQGLSPTEPLFFEATGVETGNKTKRLVKTVFFKVEGKPAKKLYYSTAIGELAPSENQSSTQGQGQDVPPLKDAVTGQTVPEGASDSHRLTGSCNFRGVNERHGSNRRSSNTKSP